MKRNRFIIFVTFVVVAAILIITSQLMDSDFYLVAVLSLGLAVVTFVASLLDPHINQNLRLIIMAFGVLFFILSMLGLLLTENNMPVSVYCLIFAILEMLNGITELNEAIGLLKEKNYTMGVLFVIDALIEITLGILMSVERHSTLRTHVILISADLFFEGIIKLINEYVEDKRGVHEE